MSQCCSVNGTDDVWIDFSHTGDELGTMNDPFNTLEEGLTSVRDAGAIHLFPGATDSTHTITKAVVIDAPNGTARIGIQD